MQPPPPNPSDKEGPFFPRINDEGFLAQICDRMNNLVMTVELSGTQGLGTWHTVPKAWSWISTLFFHLSPPGELETKYS